MINVKITDEGRVASLRNLIDKSGKNAARAMHYALFDTGDDIIEANKKAMQEVFDRPTNWTLNSLFKKVQDGNLIVRTKDGKFHRADNYLDVQQKGITRHQKAMESYLIGNGILTSGWYVVPGVNAALDANGNWSSGEIRQVIAWFKAEKKRVDKRIEEAQRAVTPSGPNKRIRKKKVKTGSPRRYLIVPIQRTNRTKHFDQPGIYRASNSARDRPLECIAVFVRKATYRKRYPFDKVSRDTFDKVFESHFKRALSKLDSR